MRTRVYKKGTRVLSATPQHQVVTFKRSSDFAEGKIKTHLSELGMDAREFKLKSAIRLEMRLLKNNLITI